MSSFTVYHNPKGDNSWCSECCLPRLKHRVDHEFNDMCGQGFCVTCGLPQRNHRIHKRPNRIRTPEYYERKAERRSVREAAKRAAFKPLMLGIDGEGQGRRCHNYVFLAVSNKDGSFEHSVENEEGLTTEQCLDFLLELPERCKLYAYSFNYDLTKILTDVDNKSLWHLFRPDRRQRNGGEQIKGPKPVMWRANGKRYALNLQGTKFTVKRKFKGGKWSRLVVVWDIWKFYQGAFIGACANWKVGSDSSLANMKLMKDQRAHFDRLKKDDVRRYCFEECRFMATLAEKLILAHDVAGIPLKSFYGAGSSASGMLENMGIREKIWPVPEFIENEVAAAFFGGRFENSVIGCINSTVYNYDISSAYPYQLCFLPCLNPKHGKWEHTRNRKDIEGCKLALVHYKLRIISGDNSQSWGPFPWRSQNGSICFPIQGNSGWVYRDEYVVGERMFPNVQFLDAWVWHSDCDCQLFEKIPEYYRERIRIGKEGPGIVLKLAMNSCYGKLAQSVGQAMFNQWIWAGLITSGCRTQLLHGLELHHDRSNLLMVATDGLFTRERLRATVPDKRYPLTGNERPFDSPHDTRTTETGKPLGGWEEKVITKGLFVARPGVYFPMNPTEEEIKEVRARGVGKATILKNWESIVESWQHHGVEKLAVVANVSRFCGAKSCINRVRHGGRWRFRRACGKGTEPSYGQWVVRKVYMSFDPMPKRKCIMADGVSLEVRKVEGESTPYRKAVLSKEAKLLKLAAQIITEQPDADYSDYQETAEELGWLF